MATTTHTITTDDLTGDEGAKPHTITLDGRAYEVDLTEDSWNALTGETLYALLSVARPIKAKNAKPYTPPANAKTTNTLAHIRTWARAQNITINDRGRIPTWITDLYHREHKDDPGARDVIEGPRA